MGTPVEEYLAHLDRIFQVEPRFHPIDSPRHPGVGRVVGIVYPDMPEPGLITGVTYGLSLVDHSAWKFGRPELILTVRSTDFAWPFAMAEVASGLRGECPFCYGDVIGFGEPMSEESEMSAFFVFGPAILEKEDSTVDVGLDLPIHIAGLYPIYEEERAVFDRIGLEAFWNHDDFDPYEVRRPRITEDRRGSSG